MEARATPPRGKVTVAGRGRIVELSSVGASERLATGAYAALTSREGEVASLVATGLTNRRIGEVLGISERMVEAHVRSILRKLGLTNRA